MRHSEGLCTGKQRECSGVVVLSCKQYHCIEGVESASELFRAIVASVCAQKYSLPEEAASSKSYIVK